MRHSESRAIVIMTLSFSTASVATLTAVGAAQGGCVVPLDNEFSADASHVDAEAGDAVPTTEGAPPIVHGCTPLRTIEPALALAGELRSIGEDGGALWIADQAALPDAGGAAAAFFIPAGARANCDDWTASPTAPAFEPSPLAPDGLLSPLEVIATPGGLGLYYELFVSDSTRPLGLRELGIGLAMRDASSGRFVPTDELLFSPDRPSYGTSALLVGTTAYVYGCASSGAFSANCFVARAEVESLTSTTGYSYWTGEDWSSEIDDATPITQASGTVAVRGDPTGEARYIMTFVPPLGSTLMAQSAPAPEGPWSASVTLGTCDLANAGEGAFCAGGQQHPELSGASGLLILSYEAASFATDAGASGTAFWPRIVALDVPSSLP
jgi:hypothetical protein